MSRAAIAVVAVVLAGLATVVAERTPAAAAPSLPGGFTWTAQPSGHGPGQLTDFVFIGSGGVITTGKAGSVRYVPPGGTPRLIHGLVVEDGQDVGLMGVALANDFEATGNLYLFYTAPTPAGTVIRISRFTADNPADPTALTNETPVLEDITADNLVHAGGTVLVAPDDTLWITIGDSGSFVFPDPLSRRAQDVSTPYGKVLHVYPDGSGVGPDLGADAPNPFYSAAQPRSWASRVYAYGFREPFRMTLRPGSLRPYVGDVGWIDREEIDVVRPGGNYGWPCWEGDFRPGGHRDTAECQAMYAAPPTNLVAPLWAYDSTPPGGGTSVTGGVFYAGASYPAAYQGAYFFGDYSLKKIWTLTTNSQDALVRLPETAPAVPRGAFAADIGGPVRFRSGPGDDIFVADIYTGSIWRLRYTPGNRPPTAVGTATQTAPGGLTVAFDATGSFDLDGDPLTYTWAFGDGSSAGGVTTEHTYASAGPHSVSLTVSDGLGGTDTVQINVVPGKFAPTVVITPPSATEFGVGDPVVLSAVADDQDDPEAPEIHWAVNLHHCPGGTCHLHPGTTDTGPDFSVAFSDHGNDTSMEIVATVEDSDGVASTASYVAQPDVQTLTVESSPPGVVLGVNDSNTAAGSTFTVTRNAETQVSAPLRHGDLVLTGWSDGFEPTHTFPMPEGPLALTAEYAPAGIAADVTWSPTAGLAVGTPVTFEIEVHLTDGTAVPLHSIELTHSACNARAPSRAGGNGDGTLESGETWTYSCTHALTSTEVPFFAVTTDVHGETDLGATVTGTTVSHVPPLTAIGERYVALGGRESFLGAAIGPEGGVPGGRMQRFQGGRIYWSAASGAHEVHGAILTKYLALGGPSSFLGFPVTDEDTEFGGRSSSFQGAKIYWSSRTGAFEVHGAIRALYESRLGPLGVGFPVTDESPTSSGTGRFNHFENGSIHWSPASGAHETKGAIRDKWASLGWELGVLGYPLTEEAVAGQQGRTSTFQGGAVYWSPVTGAHVVHGAIRSTYDSLGGPGGFVGFPLTDESPTFFGTGRFNHFEGASVHWSPATGAFETHGAIRDLWAALGWELGFLGYPITNEAPTFFGTGRYNHFQGGSVHWSPASGAHETHGAIRDKWAALGWELGFLGYPITNESVTPDGVGRYNHLQGGSVYWSPATGAHEVHGAIRDLWAATGWELGPLGYPLTDELVAPDGVGRYTQFQHGVIEWSPTTGVRIR